MVMQGTILPANTSQRVVAPEHREDVGFLTALFDYSFSQFITTRLVRALYVLATVVGVVVGALVIVGSLVGASFMPGAGAAGRVGSFVLALIVVPLAFLLWTVSVRLYLELVVVLFRIADHTRDISHNTSR